MGGWVKYLHVVTTDVLRQPFSSIYVGDTKNAAINFFGEEE